MNTRVSEIQVNQVAPDIARLFARSGTGKVAPKLGVVLYRIDDGRFEAVSFLEVGGRLRTVLEIVDGTLKSVPN
jgi:hypothetical protein